MFRGKTHLRKTARGRTPPTEGKDKGNADRGSSQQQDEITRFSAWKYPANKQGMGEEWVHPLISSAQLFQHLLRRAEQGEQTSETSVR